MNDVINIHMAVDRKKDSHPCKAWIEKFSVYRIMTRADQAEENRQYELSENGKHHAALVSGRQQGRCPSGGCVLLMEGSHSYHCLNCHMQ